MYRQLTLYKIAFLNILLTALVFVLPDPVFQTPVKIGVCIMNVGFLALALHNLPAFLKRNDSRLLIGRKRTLIVLSCSVYIFIIAFSFYFRSGNRQLFIVYLLWTIAMSVLYLFANPISVFLHKIFKKRRRVAVVGYDDTAHKLVEKLKRKSNSHFINHLDNGGFVANSTDIRVLSEYLEYAKQNNINELYISMPDYEEDNISVLTEEAEKHCIRVNFIAPQKDLASGFYHVSYIGGLPVLQRFREPLKRLHKQIIKRIFDLFVSSMVIIFILSWLIPLVSILIKLESKGPVFFKQLRTGRENNAFMCLKFRSMYANNESDILQASKNDKRITKVGSFLRKTSLDEFPQFLNVFMGDMSIVGPRPHMLHHTQQYSGKVNHYMVRLYLKPGLTGWAQVNGYRGEIKNIELMKNRVEHDIWYMENWSLLFDIKIMFLTLRNILKGEENAY
ncbi:MAG: exopolysaccharide biosynthesis polyprenyl glycosylphosphotransferase [Parafilimonas sp.]|nr:exopolysaccharide biosynthesis polyprenyl glycosylphosphotransferase [Parafilimonas sp.]